MDYCNKNIMAPMVRVGTLPARLLAIDYGADIVYTEEIIDFKMLASERVENKVLNTVDYLQKDGKAIFRTCEKEKSKLVFQLGTANAQRALKVGKMIENDVSALDINMGCPKEFSIKGGMGAALLDHPERIKEILTTLVKNLKIPVTCKIRIKNSLEGTLELVKLIESTGVAAIGVHGRQRAERSRFPNHNDFIKAISETVSIPVIANGGSNEIQCYEDIAKFKQATGCNSVMIARAAQWNLSIFRSEGSIPMEERLKSYIKYAVDYRNSHTNTKFCVLLQMHTNIDSPEGNALQHSGTLREICDIFGMADYYDKQTEEQNRSERELNNLSLKAGHSYKKRKLEDGTEMYEMELKFNRNLYVIARSPKLILYEHCVRQYLSPPKYDSVVDSQGKLYYSSVLVDGKKYASTLKDKSKKWAEQAAAVVCLRILGIDEERRTKDGCTDPAPRCQLIEMPSNSKQAVKRSICGTVQNEIEEEHTNKTFKDENNSVHENLHELNDKSSKTENKIQSAENEQRK